MHRRARRRLGLLRGLPVPSPSSSNHRQSRVVKGLPSLADEGTNENAHRSVGCAHQRTSLHRRHRPGCRSEVPPDEVPATPGSLATVTTGKFGKPGLKVVADIARFEDKVHPRPAMRRTPTQSACCERRGRTYVVDAGGNSLLKLGRHGRVPHHGDLPEHKGALTPGTRDGLSMDAVPTAAVKGPDGADDVSQLTGFPFPKGGANIFRVVPGRVRRPTRPA